MTNPRFLAMDLDMDVVTTSDLPEDLQGPYMPSEEEGTPDRKTDPHVDCELPHHVSYIPQGRGSGYYVRVERDGTEHRKFFPLSRYESPEDALDAAVEYRDELLDRHGRTRAHAEEVREQMSKLHNRMGIRGFGLQVGLSHDPPTIAAVANVPDGEGGTDQTMRSLRKHGVRGAAHQLARILWDEFAYEDVSSVEALAEKCHQALRRHLTVIYETGTYETPKGREEERVAAVRAFIAQSQEDILISSAEED